MSEGFAITLAILAGLVMIPVVLLVIYTQREREWEHQERLKALGSGQIVPDRIPTRPLWQAILVGVGVPMLIFGFAVLRINGLNDNDSIWSAVAAIAVTSAIPAVFLMLRLPASGHHGARGATSLNGKPLVDADAFDVVSRRG